MDKYIFKLYISEKNEGSDLIIKKLKDTFKDQLNINFELQIVDILKNPAMAEEDKIFIVPALIKCFPVPVKKIFGDLLNIKLVLTYLDLPYKS